MGVAHVLDPIGLILPLLLHFSPPIRSEDLTQSGFDIGNPIVFQSQGPPEGHFGWSSALVNVNSGPNGKSSWIFIGDPKGNMTRDPSYRNVPEPGVVWRCSLYQSRRGGSDILAPSCETLNIDPNRGGDCSHSCPRGTPRLEYHMRNWIGGSMVSRGNRLVISAHHWHRGGEKDPLVNGLAYWFDTEKMYTGNNQLNIGDKLTHRLIPFFYPSIPGGAPNYPHQFYSQKSDAWGRQETLLPDLAHGEAGFSLHLTGEGQLLMGAPGVQVWRGAVVRYIDSSQNFRDTTRLNSYDAREFNGYRIIKRNLGYGNEYFGYAVTSGSYFPRQWNQADPIYYASGAPRAQGLSGEVVIFQIRDTGMEEQVTIVGDQFGSYFGSVLSSTDVNHDGLDELFIGAPNFDEPITSSETFLDHGTVYMYSSALVGSGTLSSQNLIRITSGIGNKRGGRFGSAIVNLGDINEDGFNDIAIGAPFEDGQGAVYVFYGKEYLQTEWKWTLRVVPSALSLQLQGLGCSFSTPGDIDLNYTPDLAIGSFLSQSVMILRTRPTLDFETQVIYYAAGQNSPTPIRQLGANAKNFQLETCVRLKGKALEANRAKLKLDLTLSMDEGQTEPRFSFVEFRGERRVTFELEADAREFSCKRFVAQRDRVLNENSASIDPIYFELQINYRGKSRPENSPLVYGIRSTEGQVQLLGGKDVFEPLAPFPRTKRVIPEELNINSDCKNPSRCVPDLQIEAWWADDTEGVSQSKRISKVHLDWRKRLGIHVKLSNRGEPAYSPEVTFVFKHCKAPKRIDFQSTSADCQLQGGSIGEREPRMRQDCTHVFVCRLTKAIRSDEPRELVIPVSLQDIYAEVQMEEWILGISVAVRNDTDTKRTHQDLKLSLEADVGVSLVGSVTQPKDAVSVHSSFSQQYEVILTGTSPVKSLYFQFKFPTSRTETSLLAVKRPTGNGIQCTGSFAEYKEEGPPPSDDVGSGVVNGTVDTSRRRRRREVARRLPEVPRMELKGNMTLVGCGTWENPSSDHCMEVKCNMYKVVPNIQLELIIFNMKLNPNASQAVTLGEKRPLLLESLGRVEIFKDSSPEHQRKSFSQTLVLFTEVSAAPGKIPTWAFILAGIGGFLLLLLIIFGLYKMGFFKRATKMELEERKAEVAEQEATRRASMLEQPNQQLVAEQ